jgi:RNA polymerase sigma-70 factor (ECF subfamily)
MSELSREGTAIRSCQEGNLSEFTYLYDLYLRPIYRYIYGRVYDRALTEDLTSQTFLRAMESIKSFKVKENSAKSWFFAIARNLVIDHWRRTRPQVSLDDIVELPSAEDIPAEVGKTLALEQLRQDIKKLSAEQREIVTLRLWHNLSHAEIAALLGKKETAVKVAYSRAVGKLTEHAVNLVLLGLLCSLNSGI